MTARRTRRLACAAAALALAPLAGCGSSGDDGAAKKPEAKPTGFTTQPAGKIAVAGFAAMKDLHKFRLRGTMIEDGKRLNIDVRSDGTGRCAGKIGSAGEGTATFVSTAKATFLKADETFWKENAGDDAERTMSYLGSRWAKLPASKEFTTLCNISELLAQAAGLDASDAEHDQGLSVGEVTTVGGRKVVEVTSEEAKESFRLLVLVDEPHYIVQLISTTPGDPGKLLFSGFGATKPIDVPAAGEFVALG